MAQLRDFSDDKEKARTCRRLSELEPKDRAKIVGIKASGRLKRRLQDMGFIPGEEVVIENVAPLGDPISVSINNRQISIRRDEADEIEVELLSRTDRLLSK